MQLSYLDFELEIGIGQGRDFPVVARSPAGEARTVMRFPYDDLALESRLKDLQIALLRSGGKRRQVLSSEQQAVRNFGQALFDALFTGEVRNRYDVSLQQARSQGKGLRIKLQVQSPAAAALPWEYLYDPRQSEYCSLSVETPLVRYLELPQPITPLTVTPPLRMLAMLASPTDLPALDFVQEKQRIEQALQGLRATGRLEIEWLSGQTWRDLQGALRHGTWHIFHFSGHGRFDVLTDEGQLIFADDQGRAHAMPASNVGRLLANHRTLRLAWLNACEGARGGEADIFSSAASILVRRGIPAVVAMQHEITDRAAIELARTFYGALADGYPVDAALAEARVATSLAVNNTVEWGTPVLYMRAPDGVLFDMASPAKTGQARIETAIPVETAVGPAPESSQPLAQEAAPLRTMVQPASPTTVQKPRQRSLGRVLPLVAVAVAIGIIVLIANEAGLLRDIPEVRATDTAVTQPATIPVVLPGPKTTNTPTPMITASAVASMATLGPPPTSTAPAPTATPLPPTPTVLANKVVTTDSGVRIMDPVEMDLVSVPAGEFLMGSDPTKDAEAGDNEPQHQVSLAEFYIGRHEVTNAQYAAFIEATGHDVPTDWGSGSMPNGKEDHPVVNVSWFDAVAFAEWLSEETDRAFRLPTEAEWEKACRGTNGLIYPWGDVFDANKANIFDANANINTTAVGSYSPDGDSAYGATDMSGNVWEWVSDWYASDYYKTSPANNPQGPANGDRRVVRGGAFASDGRPAPCALRYGIDPNIRLSNHGFRVVVASP